MPSLFEKLLVILSAAACLGISVVLWLGVSYYQPMWPLPGVYFIEMAALGILCTVAFVGGSARGRTITWAGVGVFAGFSALGAMSVGFFYLPVGFLFGAASVMHDVRNRGPIAAHLGICLIAAIAQAAWMFIAIRLLYPGAVF